MGEIKKERNSSSFHSKCKKLKKKKNYFIKKKKPKDDNFDAKQAMSTDTMGNDETLRENMLLLRRNSIQGFENHIISIFYSIIKLIKKFKNSLLELFSGYFYEGNTIKSAVTERNTSKSIATSSTASSLLV